MTTSLSQLDLAALRLILSVAQTGRISGGALISHLSVAAASKRISDLEARLGYPLFDRHARGVVATAAGERVIAYAREVIGLTEDLQNDLSDETQGVEGSVRLFANSSAIVQFLPADLSGFLAGNRSIRLELSEHTSRDVVDALLTERSDLGIFEAGFASPGIHSVSYRRDQLALIVPVCHPLAGAQLRCRVQPRRRRGRRECCSAQGGRPARPAGPTDLRAPVRCLGGTDAPAGVAAVAATVARHPTPGAAPPEVR